MLKNKIAALVVGGVCAVSAAAFASCSGASGSSEKLKTLAGEVDELIISLSVASSYAGDITDQEEVSAVMGSLNDVTLASGEGDFAKLADSETLWIYAYDGGACSCVIWVAEDGTVCVGKDGNSYVSSVGAADHGAIKEYILSSSAYSM